MKIQLVSKKPGTKFVLGVQAALRELGHDVLRSVRRSSKRKEIFVDNKEALGKIHQYNRFVDREVPTVPHTCDKLEAASWLLEGYTVVCRTKTNGHSGDGIVLVEGDDAELIDAPLYTKYIKKVSEFRVHVFRGEVIFVQQKKRDLSVDDVNYKIRNHQFGWVFCSKDLEIPSVELLYGAALAAVAATGYYYGAVDVIYNQAKDSYYVLEVNSRPGIEGETAKRYAEKFLEWASKAEAAPDGEVFTLGTQVYPRVMPLATFNEFVTKVAAAYGVVPKGCTWQTMNELVLVTDSCLMNLKAEIKDAAEVVW
jgi:hypothetical protein